MRKNNLMQSLTIILKPLVLTLVFSFTALVYAQPLPVQDSTVGSSELTLPRFVSISAGVANMRSGPGDQYPIKWVYKRKLYPLVVIGEYEQWRQVREADGTEGWMHRVLLSGTRTALVVRGNTALLQKPTATSPAIARMEAGVLGEIMECIPGWCRLQVDGTEGWAATNNLWGTFEAEVIN